MSDFRFSVSPVNYPDPDPVSLTIKRHGTGYLSLNDWFKIDRGRDRGHVTECCVRQSVYLRFRKL